MRPTDQQAAEYLRWVTWSYNADVAGLCAERLSALPADAGPIDREAFAWEAYCDHYAEDIRVAEAMQDMPLGNGPEVAAAGPGDPAICADDIA